MNQYAIRVSIGATTTMAVVMLTYANYQRFHYQHDLSLRSSLSLKSCQKLKNDIESKFDIESIPYVHMKDGNSTKAKMEAMAGDASIDNATFTFDPTKRIGESEYSIQTIWIRVPNPVSLYDLLSFLTSVANVNNGRMQAPRQLCWLSSLVVEEPDRSNFQYRQRELWNCRELTLSFIVKRNKSSP